MSYLELMHREMVAHDQTVTEEATLAGDRDRDEMDAHCAHVNSVVESDPARRESYIVCDDCGGCIRTGYADEEV